MNAILLCEAETNIRRVYTDEILKELEISDKVYAKCDLQSKKEDFSQVEYVFSTWDMTRLTEEEIKEYLPNLKAVFYAAGSVQSFARPFLNCGVRVFSAWAANAVPVAEYTVANIVLANKGFFKSSRIFKTKKYREAYNEAGCFIGNYGAKVGIIGAGMIGKMVIEKLKSYNLKVMVFDPFLSDEKAAELGVRKVSLTELFSECNVVSNHLANNAQTVGMLNKKLFERMPENATFLNTGRGAQVVEEDLIEVLRKREDITAVLDVTYPEPPAETSAFYDLPNCILTPHIAGSKGAEVHRMAEYMKNEYQLYMKGVPCKYEVNLEMLETMA